MCKFWDRLTGSYKSSAKVVDGHLIVSLPEAVKPIVWRMELGHAKASAIEVRDQEEGGSLLVLKTPKGDVHEIAPFSQKAIALKALMVISDAMEGDYQVTHIANQNNVSEPVEGNASRKKQKNKQESGEAVKWVVAIAGVIIVVSLFSYLNSIAPTSGSSSFNNEISAIDGPINPKETTGVPVSADDFLSEF